MSGGLSLILAGAEVRRLGRRLVGPIDWQLAGAGLTVVIGPNGAGKTTFLRLLHGLERASAGSLTWSVPEAQARSAQAFVFQSPVMMRRSVLDCIAFPLRLQGRSRTEARAVAMEWAGRLGLAAMADRPAESLSRGERQKLATARALIRCPRILFLDEPTASLDGSATREIEAILASERARGTRIVMATHDMGQARRLADDVVFILHGTIHEQTPASEFFASPRTEAARKFLNGDIVT